jgi:hypothetical protein
MTTRAPVAGVYVVSASNDQITDWLKAVDITLLLRAQPRKMGKGLKAFFQLGCPADMDQVCNAMISSELQYSAKFIGGAVCTRAMKTLNMPVSAGAEKNLDTQGIAVDEFISLAILQKETPGEGHTRIRYTNHIFGGDYQAVVATEILNMVTPNWLNLTPQVKFKQELTPDERFRRQADFAAAERGTVPSMTVDHTKASAPLELPVPSGVTKPNLTEAPKYVMRELVVVPSKKAAGGKAPKESSRG